MWSSATAFPTTAATSDRHDIELGLYGAFVDSGSHLSSLSFAYSDVAFSVANCNDRPESRPFPGISLLLNEPDPKNLLLEVGEERVNDLGLHYPESLSEDFRQGDYLPLLDEFAELSLGHPPNFLLLRRCSLLVSLLLITQSSTLRLLSNNRLLYPDCHLIEMTCQIFRFHSSGYVVAEPPLVLFTGLLGESLCIAGYVPT